MATKILPVVSDRFQISKLKHEGEGVLDDRTESGFRRVQVWLWLVFEDATHSKLARMVQAWVFFCIFLSTFLELLMSYTPCEWKPWHEVSFELTGENTASVRYSPGVPADTYRLVAQPPGMPDIVRVCEPRPALAEEWPGYFILEAACIFSFTLEYVCRLVASPAVVGLCGFVTAPMNVIDLLAIVPFYIELPMRIFVMSCHSSGALSCDAGGTDFSFLKVVRLIRIARILKVTKSMHGLQVLIRTLQLSARPLVMLFIFICMLCTLFASLAFAFDGAGPFFSDILFNQGIPPDDPRAAYDYGVRYNIDSSPTSFVSNLMGWYWCVQTLTSVGYGDIFPLTLAGKVVAVFAAIGGVITLALPITIIGSNFDEEYERSVKLLAFQRSSRVIRCLQASRNGTRVPSQPPVYKHWAGHFLPWAKPEKPDPNWADQDHNIQADVDMMVKSHFQNLRIKLVTHVGKMSETMAQRVASDLSPLVDVATRPARAPPRECGD